MILEYRRFSAELIPHLEHPDPVRAPMRGLLSLWTRTPMFRLRRGPLLIQTLAICLAARAFTGVTFVTDFRGAELARVMGWNFDAVDTVLEGWPAEGLEHIWALGKLVALAAQDRPALQFDGDVLLFGGVPSRLWNAPLVAQSPDIAEYYAGPDMAAAFELSGHPRDALALNCGLLGGADMALVHGYAWAALEIAQRFAGCHLDGTTTSMVVEQHGLAVWAAREGVEVATLFPNYPRTEQSIANGYAHLTGEAKNDERLIYRAEQYLANYHSEAYAAFLAGWEVIKDHAELSAKQ